MTPELQALIEHAYVNEPEEAAALQRLVEAFEPPTRRQKRDFLASVAAQALASGQSAQPHRRPAAPGFASHG